MRACVEKVDVLGWNKSHIIHFSNVSDSIFVKNNGNLVNKQKHLLQISVRELHNDMVLPILQGSVFGASTVDGKLCIRDASLRN